MASFIAASGSSRAADLASWATPSQASPAFTWTGIHVGAFFGGGSSSTSFADPFGPSIYGDNVRTPFAQIGGEIGADWQVPESRMMLGVMADGGAARLSGTNTCFAYAGNVLPSTCQTQAQALATGTGRIGYAFGADGWTLAFVKGGIAAFFGDRDIRVNNAEISTVALATKSSSDRVGYVLGAGIEHAVSPAWSIRAEYDFMNFGGSEMATPIRRIADGSGISSLITAPQGLTNVRQDLSEFKLGLIYHLHAVDGGFGAPSGPFAFPSLKAPQGAPNDPGDGWSLEAGARYWYSFGRFQKGIGGFVSRGTGPDSLISRLTYNDDSSSGEVFGRIDSPSDVFVKGFVGAGATTSGHQNDEDFAIFGNGRVNAAYSNTISDQEGSIAYATGDLGYTFLRVDRTKIGAFVGYNHIYDDKSTYGCLQEASRFGFCVPSVPAGKLVIRETGHYDSLRVGANADLSLGGGFRLQADAAYLPFVSFRGTDDHVLRTGEPTTFSPEMGQEQGVQLELVASYFVTPNLSIGLGGRYWAIWLPHATENVFGGLQQYLPVESERYGGFVQTVYRFNSMLSAVSAKY